jgi:hypothetical protein
LANKKGLVFVVAFAAGKVFGSDVGFGIVYILYHFDNLFSLNIPNYFLF